MRRQMVGGYQRMGQHHPRRLIGTLLALLLVPASSCGAAERDPAEPSQDLTQAAAFSEFRLFFAGRRHGDLPLTVTQPNDDNPYIRGRPVMFGYGFCTPPDPSEGGCALPLQIQNFPARRESLGRYNGIVRPARTLCLRGVRAGIFEQGEQFDKLLLTTGRTTVVIFAQGLEQALSVVRRLRSVRGGIRRGELLPQPTKRLSAQTGAACARRRVAAGRT